LRTAAAAVVTGQIHWLHTLGAAALDALAAALKAGVLGLMAHTAGDGLAAWEPDVG